MIIERSESNPILKPKKDQSWEAEAVFNGCPAKKGGRIHLLYRALSLPHYHASANTQMMISDIGIAQSKDGIHFDGRRRFVVPEHSWEKFGCEDPRVTKLDNKYYIFYTALSAYPFRADGIKVGLAISKNLKTIDEKHLITPFNAKGMALFPEKIKGKIWAMLTVHTDQPPVKICLISFNKEKDIWSENYWKTWYKNFEKYSLPFQRKSGDHVEVGAPPIKTKYGWLIIYSYIRNYFSQQRIFTIEAVLLDLKNPFKIIARTESPILSPEEYYEKIGLVPNIVFPSGALLKKDRLYIYYGAADTTCCMASLSLSSLIGQMLGKKKKMEKFKRAKANPVIVPNKENLWEAKAAFNPAAFYEKGKVHIVYRAMSEDNTSVLGYAASRDGINIDYKSAKPIYIPRENFEKKKNPGGNSGCEDPRITKIGNMLYMCYTAFDSKHLPQIALTSIPLKKFLKEEWDWARPVLISAPEFDNKDACIFPEKVDGKYIIFHRMGEDVDIAPVPSLRFDGLTWLEEHRWLKPRKGFWDSKKVGIAAPPIKTRGGWILFYHGVSDEDGAYRVGAVLLDLKNPTRIIGRTDYPLLEPETPYEKKGQVSNVVFPCGTVAIGNRIYIYYGGGDTVTGVATMEIKKLLEALR